MLQRHLMMALWAGTPDTGRVSPVALLPVVSASKLSVQPSALNCRTLKAVDLRRHTARATAPPVTFNASAAVEQASGRPWGIAAPAG
jgi:hypothetical protein